MSSSASSSSLRKPRWAAGASAASRRERSAATVSACACFSSSCCGAGKKSSRNIPVCPWKNWSGKRENTMRRLCTSLFSHLRPDMGMQKRILKIGLPQAVEVFGMWGIQMFCLSIISELPITGVLGVHNIAVRIESSASCPASPSAWQPPHWWAVPGRQECADGPHHHLEMHAVRPHLHDRPGCALLRLPRPSSCRYSPMET